MKKKLLLALLLALLLHGLSVAEPNQTKSENRSAVGVYLETVTHDSMGNLWVGGSVWLLQGLLLRINPAGVKVIMPPKIQTVQRLLFTNARTAWMIADYRNIYQSTDHGNKWRRVLTTDSNLEDIAFFGIRFGWVVGWNGIIYRTDDGGKTWNKQNNGIDVDLKQVAFIDNSHGWAMGLNILIATADGGKTWKDIGQPSLSLRSIAFVNPEEGWGIDADHKRTLIHTDDGGVTWKPQQTLTQTGFEHVFFQNKCEGWAVGDAIMHTANHGKTWHFQRLPKQNLSFSQISFAGVSNGGAIHVGAMNTLMDGDILRTSDGGRHWRVVSNSWMRPTTNKVYREKFPGLALEAK